MLPTVAIVGRPNVGKSSLINMLSGKRISIVDPTAGVTRDRVTHDMEIPAATKDGPPRYCTMVDTGGYGVYSGDDTLSPLTDDIERQIDVAVEEASLVIFVVDAMTGIVPLDETVAQLLRKNVGKRCPILLVANKVDSPKLEAHALEATALGLGNPIIMSTKARKGKQELFNRITEMLPEGADFKRPIEGMKLAIVGKRNAGKSTFVNALAGAERVIASELKGTTRDAIDVKFELDDRTFTAIDTAGVRKRKSLDGDIEYYSLHRALRAIRRADVVMLMIDASLRISQVDKQLTKEIQEQFKPCVIVVNKWDKVPDHLKTEDFMEYLTSELRGLDYCPIVFVSALHNDLVTNAVNTACDLYEQANHRVGTGELNRVLKRILSERGPSPRLGKQAKIYFATMPAVHPPTIALFVNHVDLFDQQYKRYMINRFRELLPYEEVPIKLLIRPRRREDKHADPIAEGGI